MVQGNFGGSGAVHTDRPPVNFCLPFAHASLQAHRTKKCHTLQHRRAQGEVPQTNTHLLSCPGQPGPTNKHTPAVLPTSARSHKQTHTCCPAQVSQDCAHTLTVTRARGRGWKQLGEVAFQLRLCQKRITKTTFKFTTGMVSRFQVWKTNISKDF
eukprot:1158483-Pelagomonas_calceolata.AAC.4